MKKIFLVTVGFVICFSLAPASGSARWVPVQASQNSQGATRQATKTFTGTVMKQGDLYVLSDKADKTNYELDNLNQASQYEGKRSRLPARWTPRT